MTRRMLDLLTNTDLKRLRAGFDGPVRAYKLVNSSGTGPTYPGLNYRLGGRVQVRRAICDEHQDCAAGVNLATLDWVQREARRTYNSRYILAVEFEAPEELAAVPVGMNDNDNVLGKFRVYACNVVAEVWRSKWLRIEQRAYPFYDRLSRPNHPPMGGRASS